MSVAQQSWSSFHHRYGSDDFRRSTDYDRVSKGPGVIRTLLKKQTSSQMLHAEEKSRSGSISPCTLSLSLRSSSTSKSLSSSFYAKHSHTSMSLERLGRSSPPRNASCSSPEQTTYTSVSKNRNTVFTQTITP